MYNLKTLAVAITALVLAACQGNAPVLSDDGSYYSVPLTGDCQTDADCATFAQVDDCVAAVACKMGVCMASVWATAECCPSDGKTVECLKGRECGSDVDCASHNDCTVPVCNPNLFDGRCNYGYPAWYQDSDGDTFGNEAVVKRQCDQPAGYVDKAGDCKDNVETVNPSVPETCNNVDDNCDGTVDEGLIQATTCGVGACAGNEGFKTCVAGEYTNDTCDKLYRATPETCNNVDDNCDGETDEGAIGPFWFLDDDDDGWGLKGVFEQACVMPEGYAVKDADCDDGDDTVHPNAAEICDKVDNDCDSETDEDGACSSCNNPFGAMECGGTYTIVYPSDAIGPWLNGYAKKPTYDESGHEMVGLFTSATQKTVTVTFSNVLPSGVGVDVDLFVMEEACETQANVAWGNSTLVFTAKAGLQYYVAFDQYKGTNVTSLKAYVACQ